MTFRKSPKTYLPRLFHLAMGVCLTLLLASDPWIRLGRAAAADSPEIAAELEQLESAGRQAGLTTEELRAVIEAAKTVQCDKRRLVQKLCSDKATDVEKRAFEKIVRMFGHPLDNELAELRSLAQRAGLTSEETAAAEKVALATGFDEDAIILRYETGKMSPVERSAFEKIIRLEGHPRAEEIHELTEVARQAGLTDEQLQTLRGLAARAGWDLEQVITWKEEQKLSEGETAVLAKLEATLGSLQQAASDLGSAKNRELIRRLLQAANCNEAETAALSTVLRKGEIEDLSVIVAMRAGKYSPAAASGLKKLESVLGKLEEFVASSDGEKVGRLLEFAIRCHLTDEQTYTLLKLARMVNYDLEAAKRLQAADRLTDAETQVLDKLLQYAGEQ